MQTRALDTETFLIDRGEDVAPRLVCVSGCDQDYEPVLLHANEAEAYVEDSFRNYRVVGANFAFDCWVLIRAYPKLKRLIYSAYREKRVEDVQLRQRLIDLATGCLDGYWHEKGVFIRYLYNLAALYQRYDLGVMAKGEDTWRRRYGELFPLPVAEWPDEAVDYAKLDAKGTLQVWAMQEQYSDFLKNSPAQGNYHKSLQRMSLRGMVTDGDTCREYLAETHAELARCEKLLVAEGLVRGTHNPKTGKPYPKKQVGTRDLAAAKARMVKVCREYDLPIAVTDKARELKLSVEKAVEGGYVSLNAEATRDSGDHVLRAYSTFTSADGIIEKVTKLQEGSKGLPLQTTFWPIKENGRCSSREPSAPVVGVQMQNLPKVGRMRNCFVSRPGYALVSIDFNMHELVTSAQCQIWLGASHKLADALNAGRDVHSDVAAMLLGCPYEEVMAGKKIAGSKYERARNQSKEVNFGGWGFMTPKTLQRQMNKKRKLLPDGTVEEFITLDRAEEIMAAWHERWEPKPYFDAIKKFFPDENSWSKASFKQFLSERVRALLDFPAACNTPFSGLAADACAEAVTEIDEASAFAEPGEPLYDCHTLFVVHDEIVLEVPLVSLHESAMAATDLFVATAQKWTPDVKLGAQPAANLFYDKNMEAVYDKNGRLTLWKAA